MREPSDSGLTDSDRIQLLGNLFSELGQGPRAASSLLQLLRQGPARPRRSTSPRRTSDDLDISPQQAQEALRSLQQQQQQQQQQQPAMPRPQQHPAAAPPVFGLSQLLAAAPAPAAVPYPGLLIHPAPPPHSDDPCPALVDHIDLMNIDTQSDRSAAAAAAAVAALPFGVAPEHQGDPGGAWTPAAAPLLSFRGQQIASRSWRRPIRVAAAAPPAARHADAAAAAAAAAAQGLSDAAVASALDAAATHELPTWRRMPPHPCSFWAPGAKFAGTQRLVAPGGAWGADDWAVTVAVQAVDWGAGRCAGVMTATNVPGAKSSVTTSWEGEVINDRDHTFYTRAWGASRETDLRHWNRLPGFGPIRAAVVRQQGRAGCLAGHPFLYLRLKETCFVRAAAGCRLTIAGFYYLALCRRTGRVAGLYFDPHSSPLQELHMEVDQRQQQQQRRGMQFSTYELR